MGKSDGSPPAAVKPPPILLLSRIPPPSHRFCCNRSGSSWRKSPPTAYHHCARGGCFKQGPKQCRVKRQLPTARNKSTITQSAGRAICGHNDLLLEPFCSFSLERLLTVLLTLCSSETDLMMLPHHGSQPHHQPVANAGGAGGRVGETLKRLSECSDSVSVVSSLTTSSTSSSACSKETFGHLFEIPR